MIPGNRKLGKERIGKLKELMQSKGLDGMAVFGNTNTYWCSGYLTIFNGDGGNFDPLHYVISVIPLEGEPVLLTPLGYQWQATRKDIPSGGMSWIDDVRVIEGDNMVATANVLKEKGCRKIGVEMSTGLFAERYLKLKNALPEAELADTTADLEFLRRYKSEEEMECVRRSADVACVGTKAAFDAIHEGVVEFEVLGACENAMKKYLAEKYPEAMMHQYPTTPAFLNSGPRTLFGTMNNYGRTIKGGDPVIIMNYCLYDGYWCEIERTVLVGKVSEKLAKMYEDMIECRKKVIESLYPGVVCSEVAQVSLNFYKEKGYKPKTPWMWIGHCNGIAPHENPDVAIGVKDKLEPGMHFCIEPTFTDFTSAGVRHSDQFIMTEKGAERLTPVSWELYK